MRPLLLAVIVVCSVLLPAWANDDNPFALHNDSLLGRVFMSPVERWELDRNRMSPPLAPHDATETQEEAPLPTREAMGYIIPHSGMPLAWRDGDFKETSDGRDPAFMNFSHNIRIVRHAESTDESRSTEDDVPPDGDDGDATHDD